MKYYVVSDIHGFFTPMNKALTDAGFFTDTEPHKLVVLGDLFDRGTEIDKLQAFILNLMKKNEVILIRGNHEDLFVKLATIDMGIPYKHHVSNGTYETALQMTGYSFSEAKNRCADFANAMKNTLFYQQIIPSTLDYFETEHYIFVHGWIPCARETANHFSPIVQWRDVAPDEWVKARWYNGMCAANQGVTEEGKTILCGHWHTSFGHNVYEHNGPEFGDGADYSPYYAPGIIALDACTAISGIVNCIVIED